MPIVVDSPSPSYLRISGEIRRNFATLCQIPVPSKKWVDNTLLFKHSGAIVQWILDKFPDAEWQISAQKHRDAWINARMAGENTLSAKQEILVDETGYEYHTAPYKHQAQAFLLGREFVGFAYFHEQGCGKTKVAIDDFSWNFEHDTVDALVIIAPNGVHSNWIDVEIPEHMPTRIKRELNLYSAKLRPEPMSKLLVKAGYGPGAGKDGARIASVWAFNVEGFTSQKAKALLELVLKNFRCFVVVDESNCIQNPGTERTKYLMRTAAVKAKKKRILTGTPLTKGIENLYSQFKFLDPNILGYTSYTAFKAHYCIMGGFENRQVVDYINVEEIKQRVHGFSHRVLKKDCVDLPPKIYKLHKFQLSQEQLDLYRAICMETNNTIQEIKKLERLEQLVGDKSANQLMSERVITTMIRLSQISCGWYPSESGADVDAMIPFKENPRMDLFMDILSGVEGKAIIWCTAPGSRANIRLICQNLTKMRAGFLEYHGAVDEDLRRAAIKAFQEDTKTKFLVCSSAAHAGLTLTAADQAFYYTNSFSLRIRLQSEDRCHRIGSQIHKKILYHDFSGCRQDQKTIKTLKDAKSMADLITDDPYSAFLDVTAE